MVALIEFDIDASKWQKAGNAFAALGGGQRLALVLTRAVNRAGDQATTAMRREVVIQTGLKYKTIKKAVRGIKSFNGSDYVVKSAGGDVRLRFFRARPTSKGVTAYPRNRKVFVPGAFMAGGLPGSRVPFKSSKNKGEVFQRTGKARMPIVRVRSGVFIAEEMVRGGSEAAFYRTVEQVFPGRLEHELYRLLGSLG